MSQPFRDASNRTPVSKLIKGMNELSFRARPTSASRRNFNVSISQTLNQSAFGVVRRGLRKREITPTRNCLSMNAVACDRFIGVRKTELELDLAHHLMVTAQPDSTFNTSASAPTSPTKPMTERDELRRMMRVQSTGNIAGEYGDDRILAYRKNMAPAAPIGHMSQNKILYSAQCLQPSSSVKKSTRFIPTNAERILDAPEFKDDYYMNVIDWSSNDVVAVALGYTVYLWNASSGDIQILFENDETNEMELPTAVKWSKNGQHVGVGFKDGTLKIYDPERVVPPNGKLELRSMKIPRQSRNGALTWKGHLLSAGYQSGQVIHHDVRVAQHITGTFNGHTREVCGLHWSYDERLLASGSGDNTVKLWDASLTGSEVDTPVFTLADHIASVRAVQFCNFKSSMLATGGGQQDHSVKLWNVHSGEMTKTIHSDSPVNAIVFNQEYREMMSAHTNGQLQVWKYPSMTQVATISAHGTNRALSLNSSPCGQFVLSAGGDETLRIWHTFKIDKSTARLQQRSKFIGDTIIR